MSRRFKRCTLMLCGVLLVNATQSAQQQASPVPCSVHVATVPHLLLLLLLLLTVCLMWHCVCPDMLAAPGTLHLVVTHKSLLRAMLCTSLGLPPRQFRAIDISNAAVCMVR